ncbi:hypothetical protein FH972_023252 [Carpinus fangiana]|uniref:AMP-dependent synthetase/ligase domain-containing protein n=1 Tax=Carpinus fangiana TaxID=176857 RepID=A0A5N6KV28_9ROSI|nr:hypothetical protein FH972_023252 [Carpinus fangiana]
MPNKSRWQIPIPEQTLPTFLFGSPDSPLPERDVFIDAERPENYAITLEGYRLWAKRFAVGLQKAGLQPGESVQVYSGNTLFFPIALVGAVMAGGKFTASNPTYNAREVAYQITNADSKLLITHPSQLDVALDAAKEAGLPKDRVFVWDDGYDTYDEKGKGKGGCKHWSSLLGSIEEANQFKWKDSRSMLNDTIVLNYSSGTTGLPKGVEITHTNYVSNALQHMYLTSLKEGYERRLPNLRWMCFLPMYHAMAQTIYCVGGPSKGIPIYLMRKFEFEPMLANVQRFRITTLQLVPPVVVAMTKSPLTKKYDLSSVEDAGSGAAPLGSEVSNAFNSMWPKGVMNLKQGYGMTEVTCSCIGWNPNDKSYSFSVGEPNANCEIKLVNPEDGKTEVSQGERGEIWVRGPNVMKGYWKNPKATAETKTSDGWLRTGDVAYLDKHGHYFVVDRIKELIKVKGLQVAPAELEAQLLEHPGINDAAVIGVTVNGDEKPRAYCVRAPGSKVTEREVQKYMESKVSRHKRLTGGVRFEEAIQKNPTRMNSKRQSAQRPPWTTFQNISTGRQNEAQSRDYTSRMVAGLLLARLAWPAADRCTIWTPAPLKAVDAAQCFADGAASMRRPPRHDEKALQQPEETPDMARLPSEPPPHLLSM